MTARGLHVALAALVIYVVVAPSTILGGDNAEFSTLLHTGGVAHPSGYPLYVLYLRAFAWVPLPPAHTAALATALLAGAQLVVLHAACRAWGARPHAASLSCAVYAMGPLALLLHTHAEVFALNGLIVAAILLFAADERSESAEGGSPAGSAGRAGGGAPRGFIEAPRKGLARVATLGLLAGLGMSNHLSCVLVAPVGLVGAVRGARESGRWPAAVGLAAAGLVVGLTPYLYFLVAHGGWGDLDSASALLDHALRRGYGTFQLGTSRVPVSRGAQLGALAASLGRGWWYLPLAAAAWAFVQQRRSAAWIALALSLVLAGPVFALASNVPLSGLGRGIVERFHLLPLLLLVVPVARGLELVVDRVPVRAGGALALVVLLAGAAASWPGVRDAEGPQVELYLRNTLRILPEDAVLLGSGDHQGFGFDYLQRARDVRPDVVYIDLEMMAWRWYRARIDARLGFATGPTSTALVGGLLAHDRVVFVDRPGTQGSEQAQILGAVTAYPFGTVVRVLPRGQRPPKLDELEAENAALLEQMSPRGARPSRGDGWSAFVYARYAAPWQSLADTYTAAHRPEDAARMQAIADQLAPD